MELHRRRRRVIASVGVVTTFLNAWGTDGSFDNADSDEAVLAAIGRTIIPAFAPMGIEEDNRPPTADPFTGPSAEEAVVGTLDALCTDIARDTAPAAAAAPALGLAGGVRRRRHQPRRPRTARGRGAGHAGPLDREGRVARLDAGAGCTRCGRQGRCSASADGGVELHRWVEVGADDPPAGTSSP